VHHWVLRQFERNDRVAYRIWWKVLPFQSISAKRHHNVLGRIDHVRDRTSIGAAGVWNGSSVKSEEAGASGCIHAVENTIVFTVEQDVAGHQQPRGCRLDGGILPSYFACIDIRSSEDAEGVNSCW
jgi:hypothetical protein